MRSLTLNPKTLNPDHTTPNPANPNDEHPHAHISLMAAVSHSAAVKWLGKFLRNSSGGVVIVSHDEGLLEDACDGIVEVGVLESAEGRPDLGARWWGDASRTTFRIRR